MRRRGQHWQPLAPRFLKMSLERVRPVCVRACVHVRTRTHARSLARSRCLGSAALASTSQRQTGPMASASASASCAMAIGSPVACKNSEPRSFRVSLLRQPRASSSVSTFTHIHTRAHTHPHTRTHAHKRAHTHTCTRTTFVSMPRGMSQPAAAAQRRRMGRSNRMPLCAAQMSRWCGPNRSSQSANSERTTWAWWWVQRWVQWWVRWRVQYSLRCSVQCLGTVRSGTDQSTECGAQASHWGTVLGHSTELR